MKLLDFSVIKRDVRSVGFFGVGISTLALMKRVPRDIKITLRSEGEIDRASLPSGVAVAKIYEGARAFADVDEDVLFLSPSVRRDRRELRPAIERGVTLSSDFEMFLSMNEKPLFLVSGSDGKSTVTTMLAALLSEEYGPLSPIGNVGNPFCDALDSLAEVHVAELSSFQLQYASPHSYRAALTSITPNHLNWHLSFEEYVQTKLSLLENSSAPIATSDRGIVDNFAKGRELFAICDSERTFAELRGEFRAQIYMTAESGMICKNGEGLIPIAEIRRCEKHNVKNLMTAIAMADGHTDRGRILKLARSFQGLTHRCERFLTQGGVDFIDSSIDTTPARTKTTLSSLGESVIVILGGLGKGVPYGELSEVLKSHAKEIIITGANKYEIFSAVRECARCHLTETLTDATYLACALARRGDTVLLSPASTSYDAFTSYQKRGEFFKKTVAEYYNQS